MELCGNFFLKNTLILLLVSITLICAPQLTDRRIRDCIRVMKDYCAHHNPTADHCAQSVILHWWYALEINISYLRDYHNLLTAHLIQGNILLRDAFCVQEVGLENPPEIMQQCLDQLAPFGETKESAYNRATTIEAVDRLSRQESNRFAIAYLFHIAARTTADRNIVPNPIELCNKKFTRGA